MLGLADVDDDVVRTRVLADDLASGKIDDETTGKIEAVMADIAGTYKA